MKYRNLINEQSQDITVLSQLLKTYVDSYRLLIGGASELYNVNLAKKSEVKKALDRVSELGELIDKLIVSLDKCESGYIKYCKIKSDYISVKSDKDVILTEIDNELDFQDSKSRDEDEYK
ncbi:hypothetical protein SR42_02230 [Clostridium botulinum]|uniref:hypothetical protein n=1 Tax=Clostridium botulinum TaxID=1491 RepID=UPI000596D4FC|nr:hypothetical protein [Clostridium botulinum]KIL07889.1 hypothetical protein SR42_02230 [Clostridium botulinum]MBY6933775.1 hypothetical protein [Clostridium botulinum]NFL82458.1 hypothetical protein [Clostridium botulinum]NFN10315.1 hypothetical protein [Clostridium botulinum]NFO35481.1 hypothetical protein [Clostridium botulinum]